MTRSRATLGAWASAVHGAAVVLAVSLSAAREKAPDMAFRAEGQTAQAQLPPVFRGGIDVVNVDVSVLDKDRRPVRGLTAADFTVLEDGKERPILAFSAVDVPSPPRAPVTAAPWLKTAVSDVSTNDVAPDGRLIVIVMDWTIRHEDLDRARRIASAAVEAMGPHDLGGVIFTSGFSNGGVAHNFTSDKARLLEAIGRPMTTAPIDADGELLDLLDDTYDVVDMPSCVCGVCAYEKVSDVADAVANIPGRRKSLLFISTYFPPPSPRSPPPGPTIDDRPPGQNCGPDVIKARDTTALKLALANVTAHVVDPSGGQPLQANLGTHTGVGESLRNTAFARHVDLPFLSNLTGGRHVFNDNRAELTVPAIMDESSSYYLIAFPAAEASRAADGANRIQVKVRGRDLIVQARSAYRPGNTVAAIQATAKQTSLVEAVRAALPRTDQRLALAAAFFPPPRGGRGTPTVAVVLRAEPPAAAAPVAAAPVASPPVDPGSRRHDIVNGVVIAFDPDGKIVASKKHAGQVDWAPGTTTPRAYELLTALELPPGRYEIRAAIDSSAGTRSSVYGFVEVPKFQDAPLTLSGIALAVRPAVPSGPKGALDLLLPIVPTARREFMRSDEVMAFLRIHHGRDSPPPTSLVTRIVDSRGEVIREDLVQDASDEHQLNVPVMDLPSGEYLLEFVAESGTERATRSLRFKLRP